MGDSGDGGPTHRGYESHKCPHNCHVTEEKHRRQGRGGATRDQGGSGAAEAICRPALGSGPCTHVRQERQPGHPLHGEDQEGDHGQAPARGPLLDLPEDLPEGGVAVSATDGRDGPWLWAECGGPRRNQADPAEARLRAGTCTQPGCRLSRGPRPPEPWTPTHVSFCSARCW